jgi:alpha-galactosidase
MKQQTIHLMTDHSQLSLQVLPSGHVVLAYFGEKIGEHDFSYLTEDLQHASYLADTDGEKGFKLEQLPLVYGSFGNPDMRTPAHQETLADGSRLSDFRYHTHYFCEKKARLAGLPQATAAQSKNLVVELLDEVTRNCINLQISAFPKYDVFTQAVTYYNHSTTAVTLTSLQSLQLSFLRDDLDLVTLSGAWGRENEVHRRRLVQGVQGVDSKRGASGHGQNPFIAVMDQTTTENQGLVYAATLLYSGNFQALAEVDMHQNVQVQLGINPFEFSWNLAPGEHFTTPEAVFLTTEKGLNDMSQHFHRFLQDCVIRSPLKNQVRPVLLNNWEATYFDFNEQKLVSLAKEASRLGIELFVLDDGWFGQRNDETSSLGDWVPNHHKLGGSLQKLIQTIQSFNLDFGLCVEPEMVSPNSDLYRSHPEWAVHVPNRQPQLVRQQLVLDLSQTAVQDYLIATLDKLLSENDIAYIKWDMNRNLTDSFSQSLPAERQREFAHRYILGLYRILESVTQAHPNVLFESCAGGGGRFDAGMLYYMPQTWTSDDTDAIARLAIQKGTSLLYPPVCMGCHVSAVPNHQVGRVTPLHTRTAIAAQGNLGYELDLLHVSETEKQTIKHDISLYKKQRGLLQFGKQYRLPVYDATNQVAWLKISADATRAIVTVVNSLARANTVQKRLKLVGLAPEKRYQVDGKWVRSGKELMQIGLQIPKPTHDFEATQWYFEEV